MAGALRNTMVWLGLAEEGADDVEREPVRPAPAAAPVREQPAPRAQVTPINRGATISRIEPDRGGTMQRITTIHPRSYNDAKAIGESFRDGVPVIVNLSDLDDSDAKRLVDFSAGLVFGLHGAIERVTNKVFLLSPSHIEVSTDEKPSPAAEASFFNQS